jgi:hypothetical protein
MPTGFIENTPFSLTTSDLLQALNHARYMHERLLVAYYKDDGHGRGYHLRGARQALQEAAAAMGYNLVAMPDPDDDALPTGWIEDSNEDERNGLVIHNVAS